MSIELITGPMFSGKTTELMRRLERAERAGKRVVAVKHSADVRYSVETLATHAGGRRDAISAHALAELPLASLGDAQVIGIDEGQFFADLAEHAALWAAAGKKVIVSALNGTYERKPWPVISLLMPLCDDISHLSAVCSKCGADAPFSVRTVANANPDAPAVGGAEAYVASCRKCYKV